MMAADDLGRDSNPGRLDVVNGLAFLLLLSSLLTPQITLQGLPHSFMHMHVHALTYKDAQNPF